MEDKITLTNEQTSTDSQAEASEKDNGENKSEVSLGQFKDKDALINAYNSLRVEFTKRCQKIKELESELADKDKTPTELDKANLVVDKDKTPTIKEDKSTPKITEDENSKENEILKNYLKGIMGAKSKAIVMDSVGGGVVAPVNKPKTITDAGKLAKQIL